MTSSGGMNPLIYVVDDDPSFRLLLERVLAKDFTLKTFSRAQDCLDAIDVEPPALVLTDYTMPDINGVELTGIIRKNIHLLPSLCSQGMEVWSQL